MIAEALAAHAGATARVFQDREQTVGASEVGQCARKLFWIKKHAQAPSASLRRPRAGAFDLHIAGSARR
jgi:hypothetical protein